MKNNFVNSAQLIALTLKIQKVVVFEGAQGALLDKIHGFFPHLTRTLCSYHNSDALINEAQKFMISSKIETIRVGILRAYGSRHGNGPFVTEDEKWKEFITEDHNATSRWQGAFRIGSFDIVAAAYGCKIFKPDFISLTCIDKLASAAQKSVEIAQLPLCFSYKLKKEVLISSAKNILEFDDKEQSEETLKITGIKLREPENAYLSMDLAKVMNHCVPNYHTFEEQSEDAKEDDELVKLLESQLDNSSISQKIAKYIKKIEESLKVPIGVLSMGASVAEKRSWALK